MNKFEKNTKKSKKAIDFSQTMLYNRKACGKQALWSLKIEQRENEKKTLCFGGDLETV